MLASTLSHNRGKKNNTRTLSQTKIGKKKKKKNQRVGDDDDETDIPRICVFVFGYVVSLNP